MTTDTSTNTSNSTAEEENPTGSTTLEPETNDTVKEEEENWNDVDFLAFTPKKNTKKRSAADDDEPYNSMDDDDDDDNNMENESPHEAQLRRNRNPPWLHVQQQQHKSSSSSSSKSISSPMTALHNEIVQFVELMEPLPQEIEQREALITELRTTIHDIFGDTAEMQVFGSQATGLYLPTSDIDIVVQSVPGTAAADSTCTFTYTGSPLQRFAAVMDTPAWRNRFSYLESITATRIPLVKFTVAATNISVDVSFDSPGGVDAAVLVRQFLDALPALRPLTIVLKYFLASRDLNAPYTGGVGAYMLQLMIVSFLQHRERELLHTRRVYNLGALLLDFFEWYGIDHNFYTTAISVRFDGLYFPKRNVFRQRGRPAQLALENPLEPETTDVGQSSFRYPIVQRAFATAYKTLLSKVSPGPGYYSTYSTGQGGGNDDSGLLVHILPVSAYMTRRMVVRRRRRRDHGALAAKRQKR